jgi:hypothetical protein
VAFFNITEVRTKIIGGVRRRAFFDFKWGH